MGFGVGWVLGLFWAAIYVKSVHSCVGPGARSAFEFFTLTGGLTRLRNNDGRLAASSAFGQVVVFDQATKEVTVLCPGSLSSIKGLAFWAEHSSFAMVVSSTSELVIFDAIDCSVTHHINLKDVAKTGLGIFDSCAIVGSSLNSLTLLIAAPSDHLVYEVVIASSHDQVFLESSSIVLQADSYITALAFVPPKTAILATTSSDIQRTNLQSFEVYLNATPEFGRSAKVLGSGMVRYDISALEASPTEDGAGHHSLAALSPTIVHSCTQQPSCFACSIPFTWCDSKVEFRQKCATYERINYVLPVLYSMACTVGLVGVFVSLVIICREFCRRVPTKRGLLSNTEPLEEDDRIKK